MQQIKQILYKKHDMEKIDWQSVQPIGMQKSLQFLNKKKGENLHLKTQQNIETVKAELQYNKRPLNKWLNINPIIIMQFVFVKY